MATNINPQPSAETVKRVNTTSKPPVPYASSLKPSWITTATPFEAKPTDQKSFDYIIIGSGISGTIAAYELLQHDADLKIAILESREVLCSGATGRNGGNCKPSAFAGFNDLISQYGDEEALKIANAEFDCLFYIKELIEREKIECEWNTVETVDLFFPSTGDDCVKIWDDCKETLHKYLDRTSDRIKKTFKFYTGPEAVDLFNLQRRDCVGAFSYECGSLSPFKLVHALLSKLDVATFTNCTVSSYTPTPDGVSVETSIGTFKGSKLILATNAWSSALVPSLTGKIYPVRSIMSSHRQTKETEVNLENKTYSFVYPDGFDYLVQRPFYLSPSQGKGAIMVGGGARAAPENGYTEVGLTTDVSIQDDIASYLSRLPKEIFKECSTECENIWSGVWCGSADAQPWVGEVDDGKVYLTCGFHGQGMVKAGWCARSLVRSVLGEEKLDSVLPSSWILNNQRIERVVYRGWV